MDIGYLVLISLIFTILILMVYDVCNSNKIAMYHILVATLVILAGCIIGLNNTKSTALPKPNTHPAGQQSDIITQGNIIPSIYPTVFNTKSNGHTMKINTSDVKPIIDKTANSTASPITPNAYDVCVGLLDGKTPVELAKIADEMRSTTSDGVLERDASSLNPHWKDSPTEDRRLIAMELYPFMSGNQINTHDCLNDLGNSKSCFQSPSLMTPEIANTPHKIEDNLAANSKRTNYSNQATAVLNLREGFMTPNSKPATVDFPNAPGNQDQIGRLVIGDLCTHCKIDTCFNGYCGSDNYYFL
jgi:hypothetical protein